MKLLLTWDIKPERAETYLVYATKEFPVLMRKAGLELTDAWVTVYGDWPQVTMGFLSRDPEKLKQFVVSKAWQQLREQLLTYVENFKQKIVVARGGFQF